VVATITLHALKCGSKENKMRQSALSVVKKKRISKAYQGAQKKQYNEGHADFYTTTSLREAITEKRQTHCSNSWCHDDWVYQPVIP
jgi:hypothetical protein